MNKKLLLIRHGGMFSLSPSRPRRSSSSLPDVILTRNEIPPRLGIVGRVRLHHPSALQYSIRHHPARRDRVPIQRVVAAQHGEVGQADLVRVAGFGRGQAEEAGVDRALADVQLKVSAVVELRPLQLAVVGHQPCAGEVGRLNSDVLPSRAGAGDGGAGKLHANTPLPGSGVIVLLPEPYQITDPVGVRVSRNDNVVSNVVVIKCLISPIAIREVTVPRVVIERVHVPIRDRCIQSGEDWAAVSPNPTENGVKNILI